MIRLLIALVTFFSVPVANAVIAIEGLYGPEFTFTHNGNVSDVHRRGFIEHLRRHLVDNQPPGAQFIEDYDIAADNDPVFRSPNGWWFKVTQDPGVAEILMSPLTLKDFKRFKGDIQDAIFASAANSELYVWDFLGGGHINFDTRIFGGDILLARNFLVDFWNHSELAMGIFGYDTINALPLALYRAEDQDKIRWVLDRAAQGRFSSVEDFFEEVNHVLNKGKFVGHNATRGKHHDLNLATRGRVEIRCVRPQTSMDVWINQIELIEARINNHLRKVDKPIGLKYHVPPKFPLNMDDEDPKNNLNVPPVSPQRALKTFSRYVKESGLEWKDHRAYIWPAWKGEELKRFECENWLEE